MLVAKDIVKRFGGLAALDGASVEAGAGEIVGLAGPNGSGKTTLLNIISGFESPDAGSVWLGGKQTDGLPPWRASREGLRRTFQLAAQPAKMTVVESMLCGADMPVGAAPLSALLRPRQAAAEQNLALDRAGRLLETLELAELRHASAASLSGGQQKLLSLGVALMADPMVLLLDEPTAGVNPTLRVRLAERIRQVRDAGTTVLLVEHDMSFIRRVCDRVFVLDKGHVVTCCRPEDMANDPRVVAAYLGTRP